MVGNDFRGSRMPPKPFTDIIAGLWKPKSAGHNLVQVLTSTQLLLKILGLGHFSKMRGFKRILTRPSIFCYKKFLMALLKVPANAPFALPLFEHSALRETQNTVDFCPKMAKNGLFLILHTFSGREHTGNVSYFFPLT